MSSPPGPYGVDGHTGVPPTKCGLGPALQSGGPNIGSPETGDQVSKGWSPKRGSTENSRLVGSLEDSREVKETRYFYHKETFKVLTFSNLSYRDGGHNGLPHEQCGQDVL